MILFVRSRLQISLRLFLLASVCYNCIVDGFSIQKHTHHSNNNNYLQVVTRNTHKGIAKRVVNVNSSIVAYQQKLKGSRLNAEMSDTVSESGGGTFLTGDWVELHGNYLLYPPSNRPPKALIHFLGAAFFGATPAPFYRYLLEQLRDEGYLIVATPYQLSFDHLSTCNEIIQKFELIAPSLALNYGALPVVGLGHSCGSLLQVLISSLFPDTPRALNILISYNNFPIKEAVPLFEEVIKPLSTTLAGGNIGSDTSNSSSASKSIFPNTIEGIKLGLKLSRTLSQGEIPTDKLLTDIARCVLAPFPYSSVPPPENIELPEDLRQNIKSVIDPVVTTLKDAGVVSGASQFFDFVDQLPELLEEVANGVSDFNPPQSSISTAARRAYRARSTLLIQFEGDTIDETEKLESWLVEAERLIRMKRPMVSVDVQRQVLQGNHLTPLLAPPVAVSSRAEEIVGKDVAQDALLYKQTQNIVTEIVEWLEKST